MAQLDPTDTVERCRLGCRHVVESIFQLADGRMTNLP
jgi:hypothetical protein